MPDNAPTTVDTTPATTPPRGNVAIERAPVLGTPASFEDRWKQIQGWAKSELVPKAYYGKPHDMAVAVQMGTEIGFSPMQAIQSIAVINGRPSLFGDGLLALVMAAPAYQDHQEYFVVAGAPVESLSAEDFKSDATTAVCTFQRKGKATPVTRSFSIADAKRAGLWGGKSPTWQAFPQRMLQMRARGFAARDAFPDVLKGISSAEDWIDVVGETPAPVVRRMSDRVAVPTPPPPAFEATPPAPDEYTIHGPVRVLSVEPMSGGAAVRFADVNMPELITQAWAEDPRLIDGLRALAGTDTRVIAHVDTGARILGVSPAE